MKNLFKKLLKNKAVAAVVAAAVYIYNILNMLGWETLPALATKWAGVHPYPIALALATALAAAVAEEEFKKKYIYSGALLFIALEYLIYTLSPHAAAGIVIMRCEAAIMHLITLYLYSRGESLIKGITLHGGYNIAAVLVAQF